MSLGFVRSFGQRVVQGGLVRRFASAGERKRSLAAQRFFSSEGGLESNLDDEPDNFTFDEECELFEDFREEDSDLVDDMFGSEWELLSGNLDVESLPIVDRKDPNVQVGEVKLNKSVWGVPIRRDIVHRVICWQRAGWRQPTGCKGVGNRAGDHGSPFNLRGGLRSR